MATTEQKGKVKFFNSTKGFGFIISDVDGKEYFCHVSGTLDIIKDNDAVTFNLEQGRKGLMATGVKRAK
jgi:cold shock protein